MGDGQQASAYHGQTYEDCIFFWKKVENSYERPRILCRHRGSFHTQKVHVHRKLAQMERKFHFQAIWTGMEMFI